jgi:hypothetical protein
MRAMIEIRSERKGKNSESSKGKPSIGSLSKSVSLLEQSPIQTLVENKRSPSKEKKERTA